MATPCARAPRAQIDASRIAARVLKGGKRLHPSLKDTGWGRRMKTDLRGEGDRRLAVKSVIVRAMLRAGEAPRRVWPVDVLHYAFFTLLFAVSVFAFPQARACALVARLRPGRRGPPRPRGARVGPDHGAAAAMLRLAHGVLVVPLVFTQVGVLIQAVRAVDYAAALERLDRALFLGINPLEALERVSSPWLTEVMQWAYTSYLLLPIGLVALLAWKADGGNISRSLFSLLGVMYLSYAGYFLVPASGPNIHCNLARPGACPIESSASTTSPTICRAPGSRSPCAAGCSRSS